MKQTRFIQTDTCGLHVRETEDGQQSRTIEGKPIVFGVRSVNLTPWSSTREVYEVLEPGCITNELLQRSDVILNLNHSSLVPDVLGRCMNGKGTLSLRLAGDHIECSCDLPNTNNANDALELMKRGDITGMSFAFSDDYQDSENGVSYERTEERTADGKEVWLRHVKRITGLYDVSIVTHPAYEQTSVGTREASDAIDNAIDAQLKREQGETPEEKQAREERELEEQAEKARVMMEYRLRSQRRHMIDNIINNL
jgi:HK97 family phage prohead protease